MYVGIMFNEFISSHLSSCVSVAIICHTLAFVNNILQRCCIFIDFHFSVVYTRIKGRW